HDSQGRLWVGYYQTGIDVFSADRQSRRYIPYMEGDEQGLGAGTVFKIFEDRQGQIWVGTYRGGLQKYQEDSGTFYSYRHDEEDPYSISGNDIRDIAEDAQGRLWLAVHGGGVNSFDPNTGRFEHWRSANSPNQRTLADDWVFCLEVDRRGHVVVGSVQGVSWLNPQDGTTKDYNQANSGLAHNRVRSLAFDDRTRLWVGTENGLSRWLPEQESFMNYGEVEGLPNSFIDGIIEDPLGKLWLSTNDGLVRLHPDEGAFEHYTKRDGLQGPEFFPGAYTQSEQGTLYFGGQQGITWLTPSEIIPNRYLPPVHLTAFRLFNQPVKIGEPESPLTQHVSQTDRIVLEHDQNFVGFEFVALNYVRPEKNRYEYRLDGLENHWNAAGNRTEASYTNLSPGTYKFRVRGANNDGLWNPEEATVELVVRPPWWLGPWAYGVYSILFLLGLYGFKQFSLNRERLKNSLALAKVEAEKERELDRMKLKFFANISHEFRTPLTLLLGPLEKLLGENAPQRKDQRTDIPTTVEGRKLLRLMERNGQRLLRLINQLLDITELEAGFMALRVSEGNVQEFARTILEAFEYRAVHKQIKVEFSAFPSRQSAWFDADKLEKILYNLLSNAFKFTPEGGTIRLSLSQSTVAPGHKIPAHLVQPQANGQRFVRLVVEDSGPGIPEAEVSKIFDRFYQVSQTAYKNPGTGIGLALTRDLVERHYGDISVESSPEQGTRITLWLPVSEERYTQEEITNDQLDLAPRMRSIQTMNRQAGETEELPCPTAAWTEGEDLPTLMVVEDNDDIREFVRLECQDAYRIIEARNGEEGLAMALEQIPDLVISDVMMPRMDGLELCKLMKADHRTSHIPVILLTARSSEQYTLQGLATGADDYITKPFSVPVLKARMQNLLDTRKRLQAYYGHSQPAPAEAPPAAKEGVSGAEEAFLAKARIYVEEHLADTDLNPDNLASALLMSRAQLYKKLKALTGLSVSIFVRHVRLAKALLLLQEDSDRPVGEVGYFVGFSDPAYFTKCFKERYGMAPSEARRAS
ncbi:MAG: ATP-binding protein, partial [Bacteroidota bacterium]